MWGWLRGRAPAPSAPRPAPDVDLFDPAFQRTLEALAIVARRVFAGRMRAERRSRRVGSGIEFADHRPYATGDDIRAIDWNIYRRHRRLAVRMFHEEADITVHVLLDCSASMAVPSAARLVFAKRLAAAVAYIALANLDRVSVQTFSTGLGAALAPTRGKARVFKVFRFLAARTPEAGTNFANAARAFVARTKRSGPAVVITDGYDPEGIERGVDTLRHHGFDPFVIELVDPDEAKDDWAGDLELVDAETGDVRVVTMTRDTFDGYRSRRAARSAALARALREKQVRHLALNIHTPLPDAIMELLRHGGLFA